MSKPRQIKLGLILETPGASFNSWLHPTTPKDASVNFQAAKTLVQMAEGAKFAFAFVADNVSVHPEARPHYLSRLEPIALLSALSSVTTNIGLVATISTTYSAPYTTARQVGSLDVMSGGRAGWNVVTTALAGAAANFGGGDLVPHDERYVQAEEYLEVVQGLWDTWDDDAFPRDRSNRTFADFTKMHVLDHHGKYFDVRGPLNLCRSAQGRPVTFQAGSSGAGRNYAARFADGIFAREYDIESAKLFYADMKSRAASFGRDPKELNILMGAQIIVGRTLEEAEAKYETIMSYTSDADALKNIGNFYNHLDFSQFDLDAPFPDVSAHGSNFHQGLTSKFEADARRLGLTLRQVVRRVATQKEDFFGTPSQVADAMQAWFEGGAADGFLVSNWVQPDGLKDFVELVVPELRKRGLYPDDYAGKTLRENLGLPFAESRYAEKVRATTAE